MASSMNKRRERLFKVIVTGDVATGKSSIIKRYVHDVFSTHYKATIGVDFSLKALQWDDDMVVRLQLWDIAGQERFGNMTRVFYKEAVGGVVVYDMSRNQTLDSVRRWKKDIDEKVLMNDGRPIPCILIGNKSDLPASVSRPAAEMDALCQELGFVGWFETSAKNNSNIDTAMQTLVSRILERHADAAQGGVKSGNVVSLGSSGQSGQQGGAQNKQSQKKSGCC
ncbi:Ras-related protein Rab32 [Andalucia godoyi]|uniref:Ras-related protein Rab n=1 Tax=Andalucia godoyi TaxID=505711 RepID=A0A8K0F463_ANDGO|nr:Ras-related protein Rab32 [Andalucia godoyi]|eukprot:ANDGO_00548.mRNA.1 Ras-related protein Rab32